MKYLFSLLLVAGIALQTFAKDDFSLTVYETYEEYASKKGKPMYEFIGFDWTLGILNIYYRITKKEEGRLNATKIYGFSVGDQFYRVIKSKPYRVLMEGKIIYYENGLAHLNMLVGGEDEYGVEQGEWHMISADMNSELVEFPSSKATKEFGERAELKALFLCVDELRKKKTENIRECVKSNN